MKTVQLLARGVIVVTVVVALLGGLGTGLARLGWQVDPLSQGWMMLHGPLMICGFLGTLICLERAVALASRYPWSLAVPVVNAAGALAMLVAPDTGTAKLLLTLGSVGLLTLFVLLLRLHPLRYMMVMTAGAWISHPPVRQLQRHVR